MSPVPEDTLCPLCDQRQVDAFTDYTYELKYGKSSKRTYIEKWKLQIPVCTPCERRWGRLENAMAGAAIIYFGLGAIVVLVMMTSQRAGDAIASFLCTPALISLLVVFPVLWILEIVKKRRINEWLQAHQPLTWEKINTPSQPGR
jgi:uncharacterized protein (DUF983 family)